MIRLASVLLCSCVLASGQPGLNHVATYPLPEGTHRPEIMTLPNGGFMVVVVQPDNQQGVGRIKHRAYRLDGSFNLVAEPFPVTRITAEYGEPADHRATIVNGELAVVYQSLVFPDGGPPPGGPAENFALEQSLMLARFTLDGKELDRRPIVAHQRDFSEDNFPDFCILWRGDRLLAGTGSLSPKFKIREVTLDGAVPATHILQSSPSGIGGTLGNSLYHDGSQLFVFSATEPQNGALAITALDADFRPVKTIRFTDAGREQNFPVGNFSAGRGLYVAYISHPRGGPPDLLQNPYFPYLKILNQGFEMQQDFQVGEGAGFSHVHPAVIGVGNRLLVAWSKAVNHGAMQAPQVQIEEYSSSHPRDGRR